MSVDGGPAEQARAILADLIRQRQVMRQEAAESSLLEANRLGIVYWQSQLTRAQQREAKSEAA